jgi:hypothetical protein
MLAEGAVLPVWTPALVGTPVVLDANGAVIDGTAGAIFRLLGSGGGARDIVELGVSGLVFGGDTEVSAPALGSLAVGGRQRNIVVLGPFVAPVGYITAGSAVKVTPMTGREAIPGGLYDNRPNFPFPSGRLIGLATRCAVVPTGAGLAISSHRNGANIGTPITYGVGASVYQTQFFPPVAIGAGQSCGINFDAPAGYADAATQAFSAWVIAEVDYPTGVGS